jgi:NADH-quinone oxidoreductase subunit N
VSDPFAVFFKVLILLASILTLAISQDYMEKQDIPRFEYVILLIFATLGMMLMVSANNLLSLYLGLEMQSLSLYVIASFNRDNERSTEAGLKYFVLGSLMSCLFLLGFALIYLSVGSTSIEVYQSLLAFDINGYTLTSVGVCFILLAILFKLGAFPFHLWLCDVYEGSLISTTLFFAIVPKIVLFYILVKFLFFGFANMT